MKDYEYIMKEERSDQKDEVPTVDEESEKDEEMPQDRVATLDESENREQSFIYKGDIEDRRKTRRRREKMLNKSTGLLAGAAAVTVVAGTLSSNICPICHQEIQEEVSYTCPICYEENCELWDDRNQEEITSIELEGDHYTVLSGNENQLGLRRISNKEWRDVENRTSAIRMKDGRRAYIHYVPDEYIEYDMVGNTSDGDRECLVPAVERMTREVEFFGSLNTEGEKHVTLVELIYMPDGTEPQEENLIYEVNEDYVTDLPYVYSELIPDTENLWLRISTTEKDLDIERLWKDTDVKVLDADVRELELGSSMVFIEDDKHACTWHKDYTKSLSMGWGADYSLYHGFEKMKYDFVRAGEQVEDLYMFYIEIASVEYEVVFDKWQELNNLAEKRGHNVWIPVYQLEDYKCNDITYQIYFADKTSELNSTNELYCVPEQEKSVAVRISVYDSDEKMSAVQDGVHLKDVLSDSDFAQVIQTLDNIYLR
jgi:hypothetical protein